MTETIEITQEIGDALNFAAQEAGRFAGRSAASWQFDGNTQEIVYSDVLRGIEDGDPAIMDTLPWCDLSGQWADGLSPREIVREVFATCGLELDEDEIDAGDYDFLVDVYELEFNATMLDEITSAARAHLAE